MQNDELTLRERRRERTWNAIHEAAVELVKKNGLKKTTTDEIAERAGISVRTFFNYFATKEDAVLGIKEPVVTESMIAADKKRQDTYIFDRVVLLMLDLVSDSLPEHSYQQFRKLAMENPEFRERFKVYLGKCERALEEFLRTIDWAEFNKNGRRGEFTFLEQAPEIADDDVRWQKGRASVKIATAVLRYIDLSQGIPDKVQREELVRDAVALFRNLLRED
ncbi:MAG: helix-turn-helix domain-containing protein [Rothia sp. (in: high G+C Gram-positive bacteria)]|nr:helix-turn-helix domain-containing protein [Rothia sp. (in: high G+C Gram-positive bacteria)]